MTNLFIHPEVGDDIAEAVNWYKGIDPELAVRLGDVVYGSIERARESPWLPPKIYLEYRRVLCEPFPYKVIFEVLEAEQAVHIGLGVPPQQGSRCVERADLIFFFAALIAHSRLC